MTLGKGRAEAITDSDIAALADSLQVHPADLEAIAEVEANGFGWFPDGRMKILFEKHWFYKYLDGAVRTNAMKSGLARKNWISPKKGGYKDQSSPDARYKLLERAMKINEEGALKSISMGRFQIMGFNHAACGFVSAKQMWTKFLDSERYQLEAFAKFLKSKNLIPAIRSRNFELVEDRYNGGGLGGAYAKRMKAASDKLRAGKWENYKAGSMAKKAPPAPVQPVPAPKSSEPQKPAPEPRTGYSGLFFIITAIIAAIGAWLGFGS